MIENGKIREVGAADRVRIPEGYRILTAAVVTPGLVDAHATVGLTGQLNFAQDQDQRDPSEPLQPELRAVDAFNIQERLVEWVRGLGVTTVHTGHGPGSVVSGQTMITKTWGNTVDEAVMVPEPMVAVTLGPSAIVSGDKKSPGTRGKTVAMLRQELVNAQEYRRKRGAPDETKRPARSLRLETLARVPGFFHLASQPIFSAPSLHILRAQCSQREPSGPGRHPLSGHGS